MNFIYHKKKKIYRLFINQFKNSKLLFNNGYQIQLQFFVMNPKIPLKAFNNLYKIQLQFLVLGVGWQQQSLTRSRESVFSWKMNKSGKKEFVHFWRGRNHIFIFLFIFSLVDKLAEFTPATIWVCTSWWKLWAFFLQDFYQTVWYLSKKM